MVILKCSEHYLNMVNKRNLENNKKDAKQRTDQSESILWWIFLHILRYVRYARQTGLQCPIPTFVFMACTGMIFDQILKRSFSTQRPPIWTPRGELLFAVIFVIYDILTNKTSYSSKKFQIQIILSRRERNH